MLGKDQPNEGVMGGGLPEASDSWLVVDSLRLANLRLAPLSDGFQKNHLEPRLGGMGDLEGMLMRRVCQEKQTNPGRLTQWWAETTLEPARKADVAGKEETVAIYLDCNATTPTEPTVLQAVMRFMEEEIGNAGSRTHEFGARAKRAVEEARARVASVVESQPDEVIFTSGATESNNLAIQGLMEFGAISGKRHVVTTAIEHKSVLEPVERLQAQGFSATVLDPNPGGWIEPDAVKEAMRDDTGLVSMMQVNNETGVAQCVAEVTELLSDHPALLHVDAAQGFGKDLQSLRDHRVDLISVSAHKIYGPKGIGALVARRRGFRRPPLKPLAYGGGQERGLRPGTLPVPLIVGLGKAAQVALEAAETRARQCAHFRDRAMAALSVLGPKIHGDQERMLPNVVNLSFPGLDSEAVMLALKDLVAVSNGAACTSATYQTSHVLKAMGLGEEEIQGALRISWCHMTEDVDWDGVVASIARLM